MHGPDDIGPGRYRSEVIRNTVLFAPNERWSVPEIGGRPARVRAGGILPSPARCCVLSTRWRALTVTTVLGVASVAASWTRYDGSAQIRRYAVGVRQR
jgi:hypothetical protein